MGNKLSGVKKAGEQIAEQVVGKATDAGTGIAGIAKKGAEQAQKGVKETGYKMRLKRYNPLSPAVYFSNDYMLPEMVVIEDGEERKEIDVCKGAIGWTSQEAKLSVVHLYRSFVEESNILFYPSAKTDCIYMQDPSSSDRYIELSCFFSTIEEEKAAELIEIGRCLGAKKCTVETHEAAKQVSLKKGNVKAKAKKGDAKKKKNGDEDTSEAEVNVEGEHSSANEQHKKCSTLSFQEFPGSGTPKRPALHWFANDTAITNLVGSFFDDRADLNPTRVRREISRSSSCAMNSKTAGKVDAALSKLGAQLNFSIDGEAKNEERQTWVLDIEF